METGKTGRRPLSPRQRTILVALVRFVATFHRQPSYTELETLTGSKNIAKYLSESAAKGWIRIGNGPRAVEFEVGVYEEITGAATAAPETTGAATAAERETR